MDVLHEVFRTNGRSMALLQHQKTMVALDRGRYLVRGVNRNPHEMVSVYLTEDEVDRLIRARQGRGSIVESGLQAALRVLRFTAREPSRR